MINTVIIEDNEIASNYLLQTLKEIDPTIEVKKVLRGVEESIAYLSIDTNIDLVFSDVELTDGLSLEVFRDVKMNAPIIFITCYEKYRMEAFEYNGIDYLLKPFNKESLKKALEKYKNLEKHFLKNYSKVENLLKHLNAKKKSRLIVRNSLENFPMLLDDIALFYGVKKIVYAIDKTGKKYIVDKSLSDLEAELDSECFFRLNRQYIVNINHVKGFKKYKRVKLNVELTLNDLGHFLIVSQKTVPFFKKWISGDSI